MFNISRETMEVINFKTAYSIGDKVYVVHGDEIKLGCVVGVTFRGDGYEYDIEIGVSYSSQKLEVRRKEITVLPTLERAIEFAVNLYRDKLCDEWNINANRDG